LRDNSGVYPRASRLESAVGLSDIHGSAMAGSILLERQGWSRNVIITQEK
jgi:hypothetical protein